MCVKWFPHLSASSIRIGRQRRRSLIGCVTLVGWLLAAVGLGQMPEVSDPDWQLQGEYAGPRSGLQVVALGEGEFELVLFAGGLPGAGWDGQPPRRLEGEGQTVQMLVAAQQLERVYRESPTLGAPAPAGAVLLFDGTPGSLEAHWQPGAEATAEGWLREGATTRAGFGDYRLHLEFQTPWMPTARGQGRGNSGVYHQGRYETQILDSFGLEPDDNLAGAIYGVRAPDLNMCLPPLSWQTYDVDFTAASFDADGALVTPAKLTVWLNGVLVQSEVPVSDATRAALLPAGPEPGPIYLQDHGNPVMFRNIWLLPRDAAREARRPIVASYERFFSGSSRPSPDAGRLLITTLGCSACHADLAGSDDSVGVHVGPDLTAVAGRVRPDHLIDFVADPAATKPGSSMPDPWVGMNAQERRRAAAAITQYLVADGPPLVDGVGQPEAAQRGEALFHQVGCVACHQPRQAPPGKTLGAGADQSWGGGPGGVPLGELEAKYTLEGLANFLNDPLAIRGHGRMPRLVSSMAEAVDLATYLLRDVVVVPPTETLRRRVYAGQWGSLPDFDQLLPEFEDRVPQLAIDDIQIKPGFGVVFDGYFEIPQTGRYRFRLSSDDGSRLILNGQTVIDHDGVHATSAKSASVELEAGVLPLRIEYFEAGGERSLQVMVDTPSRGQQPLETLICSKPTGREQSELVPSRFRSEASMVAQGRLLFETSGCAACHRRADLDEIGGLKGEASERRRGPATVGATPRGCLAPEVPTGAVDYQLTPAQRQDILAALEDSPALDPDEAGDRPADLAATLEARLLQLNCYACHRRGDVGGPVPSLSGYFQGTTPEMGDEGRLPPLLTGAGDKLTPEYLRQVIEAGTDQRPYMLTRMPGFGGRHARQLSDWLAELDACCPDDRSSTEAPTPAEATPEEAMAMVAEGRLLVGNQGLGCVKCHTFGGQGPPGIRAIDLLVMPERLRYDWLARYLHDPQKYRPGTRMPTSFPDGMSVVKEVADGDPAGQTAALWAYLSQGQQARPPVGLLPEAIILQAQERPLIYRNFITGLSPRGIAVGYPEGVNIAWDAERLALAKLWKYDFMDASRHWIGRGVGTQEPLGDALIDLDRGPSVIGEWLAAEEAWPEQVSTERQRFLGYRLNELFQPIFRYRVDEVLVEEALAPAAGEAGSKRLERIWTLEGSGPVTLRLAVASQALEAVAPSPDTSPGDSSNTSSGDSLAIEYTVDRLYRFQVEGPGRLLELKRPDGGELRWQVDLDSVSGPVRVKQIIQW